MKPLLFCGLFLLLCFYCKSQDTTFQAKNFLQLSGGVSKHGTGDLKGIFFSTEYGRYFRPKLSWSISLSSSIHDGSEPLYFTAGGQQIDGSLRYTVGGIQLGGNFGYSFLKKYNHEILAKTGIFFRYQSSSLPDQYEIAYPAATGLPYPVIIYSHSTPQRTYAIGGSLQVQYSYTINEKVFIGSVLGFQADSKGDNISHISLTSGIRF